MSGMAGVREAFAECDAIRSLRLVLPYGLYFMAGMAGSLGSPSLSVMDAV